jgi:hypothetical protein
LLEADRKCEAFGAGIADLFGLALAAKLEAAVGRRIRSGAMPWALE